MKDLIKTLDNFPKWLKILLIALWGVYGNLYRLFRSIAKKNIIGIILAAILLVCNGFFILWIIDLVMMILWGRVWWID